MSTAVSVSHNEDHIREAMKLTPERVDLRVIRVRVDLFPLEKVVRVQNEDGIGYHTIVSPVLDESGEQKFEEVKVVEYEIQRGETRSGGELLLRDVMSIDLTRPSDDYALNISKARAASIISQIQAMEGDHRAALPDDHMPLEAWGALNKHVLAVLHFNKIFSVQQLRDLSSAQIARLPGGIHANRLQEQATAYLLREQSNLNRKSNEAMLHEMEALKRDNAELQNTLKMVLDKMESLISANSSSATVSENGGDYGVPSSSGKKQK